MTSTIRARLLGRIALTTLTAAVLTLGATATAQASPAASATGYRSPACVTSHLRGALVSDGGGAAGSVYDAIRFTNTGSRACTLQGWPGVSLVGHHDGTQIGAAADQDRRTIHPTVTLLPRGSALATVRIVQALDFPASACRPVATDGFRVYPPGERRSLFVKASGITGCAKTRTPLLTVSAVRPPR